MHDQTCHDSMTRHVHVLRFVSLFNPGRVLVIPCDELGHVNLDELSERMRATYFGARAMVGREYAPPVVEALH
nr:hypothetical protein [uncultured Piscinibacter sp.]